MKKLALLLFLATQIIHAQSINTQKLDSVFDALAVNNKFFGSVAISKNDKTIYQRQVGFIDGAQKIKANENTKYRIGSITKTFTAVLVMKAIEEGKLSLDTKLSKFYPQVKHSEAITIKNLLNHSSGIHNFTSNDGFMNFDKTEKSKQQMLDYIVKSGTDFKPNEKSEYSNSNYVLLTYILEDVFKKPYAKLVKKKITKPLCLKNTKVGVKIDENNNETQSFNYQNGIYYQSQETAMSVPVGAGAIISTPKDLNTFIKALFEGKLVKKESLAQMKTMNDGFGLGMFKMPINQHASYGHNGGIDQFSSLLLYIPKEQVSIAITSSYNDFGNNDLAFILYDAAFNKPFEIPTFFTPKSEDLQSYVGTYISPKFPLKIKIFIEGDRLYGQATGQGAFPLTASKQHVFEFKQANIKFVFEPSKKQMQYTQFSNNFTMTKEE